MEEKLTPLKEKSLLVIFASAPAGLGHLRVTKALAAGLPSEVEPLLLGTKDWMVNFLHRITSTHPFFRIIMEKTQRGFFEDWFAFFYRQFLFFGAGFLEKKLSTILRERVDRPKTLLVVATHFGLAHQFGRIKEKFSSKERIKIKLIVCVTDDSPQHLWYVEKADLIFVPSQKTKLELENFGRKAGFSPVHFAVNPYPLSPALGEKLSSQNFQKRKTSLEKKSREKIQVAVPISGAAVGTDFLERLIEKLSAKEKKFFFHLISRWAGYTFSFLKRMEKNPSVKLHLGKTDQEVIEKYEEVYLNYPITLEITKPSEQAFKALFSPKEKGGVILLFSQPVGRQEEDNLDFLRRQKLLPSLSEKKLLENFWQKKNTNFSLEEFFSKAETWRGIELPRNPQEAADFLDWLWQKKIFSMMVNFSWAKVFVGGKKRGIEEELGTDGVKKFWEKASSFLKRD